ncbi:hypothetical protein CHS0354_000808 [Potamilus streckersoni]|uniref:Uncharacterized protein n=1 Tax=Potamilus streckersoni TaxID=2493646 RepID=A0AAE0T7E5_9BIVA|nr:hypothetical protein CHS0354_000808 [Potamilus streckersoni]
MNVNPSFTECLLPLLNKNRTFDKPLKIKFLNDPSGIYTQFMKKENGNIRFVKPIPIVPAGVTASPAGVTASPAGVTASPAGVTASPAGVTASPAGVMAYHAGVAAFPAGVAAFPAGVAAYHAGVAAFPAGVAAFPAGVAAFPAGVVIFPTGVAQKQRPNTLVPAYALHTGRWSVIARVFVIWLIA